MEPIYATTKAGLKLTNFDYASIFAINVSTGAITLIENLENKDLYSAMLTVRAEDLNGEKDAPQSDTCEIVFYVQSHKTTGPIFINEGWNYIDKTINVTIREEVELGSVVITLAAEVPETGEQIDTFEIEPHDGFGVFQLRQNEIITKDRIDYEAKQTSFHLSVRAVGSDTYSTAVVSIEILNVNDNSPVFEMKTYRARAKENIKSDEMILQVIAHDDDAVLSERDEMLGYSKIKYSIEGPHASMFDISQSGQIHLRQNHSLDREKQSIVQLQVAAEDSIGKPLEAHKTLVNVSIEVLDVNDVAPKFLNTNKDSLIQAVIPESSPPNTLIVNLETYDPDEGAAGEVQYEIIDDQGDLSGLLILNQKTGELKNAKALTGRGRSEPYEVKIRAFDQGNQLDDQRSLFTDQLLQIFIGDTFNNDGIPYFMSEDDEANVYENSPVGTKVYQVLAKDPDESTSLSGILRYRIQNDIEDAKFFKIEALSGVITTTQILDREIKDKYNIIVEVSDQGSPPQASARVLKINVLDVDDEQPLFARDEHAKPVEMTVLEEQSSGTVLGNVSAIDRDVSENGAIDYEIIDGNELGFFKLAVDKSNTATLITTRPIDRETYEKFLLTIKCFPRHERRMNAIVGTRDSYNREDLTLIQVLVDVIDIDDHLVAFEKSIYVVGLRYSIPLNTHFFTVRANDADSSSGPTSYQILNVTFTSQFFRKDKRFSSEDFGELFELNNSTGEIIIAKSVSDFVDGFFLLQLRAMNSRFSDAIMKIFIVRDKSILKFVFARPPMEMTPLLANFSQQIHHQLSNDTDNVDDLELITFDAQVLSKPDQIYNFSSTSSCFMLLRHENALPLHEAWKLMNSEEMKNRLRETYIEYAVEAVDSCTFGKDQNAINMAMSSSGKWLVFLSFIVLIASFISMLAACCIFKK